MKIFLLIFIFISIAKVYSADAKKEPEKLYQVPAESSQLVFGDTQEALEKEKRPNGYWYFAISRNGLGYDYPSRVANPSDFSNKGVGITLGKKESDNFFSHMGLLEYSVEWQNYERTAVGNGYYQYSQNLTLLKINFFQNYTVARLMNNSIFVSVGAGLSPVLALIDQSSLSNSASEFGGLLTLKSNIMYPIKKKLINDLNFVAVDLELALSTGAVGDNHMNMSSIKLGSNFNW